MRNRDSFVVGGLWLLLLDDECIELLAGVEACNVTPVGARGAGGAAMAVVMVASVARVLRSKFTGGVC